MKPTFTDEEISQALAHAGVPTKLHGEYMRFQQKYGGRKEWFGLNRVLWGIVHRNAQWLRPGQVDAELENSRPEVWHVVCADVHPSDLLTIDQQGRLYCSYRLRYHHYEDYFRGQAPVDSSLVPD